MATLDAAKQNKANFAKELDLDGNGQADGLDASTVDTAVKNDYNAKAGAVGATGTGVGDATFKDRSETVQDQLIADHTTSLSSELSKASNKVAGAADLVEAVRAEVTATEAAHKTAAAAETTLTGAVAAFEEVNKSSGSAVEKFVGDAQVTSTSDDTLKLSSAALAVNNVFVYEGKAYKLLAVVKASELEDTTKVTLLGTKSGSTWTLTKAGKDDVNGVADVLSAYDAANAAAKALGNAKDALAEAVEAVYINENGGYEVKLNTGSADLYDELKTKGVIDDTTTAGKYVVDYSKTVDTYDTEDDAEAGLGVVQTFTYKVTTKGSAATDTIVFDGITYTSAGNETSEATEAGKIQTAFNNKKGTSGVTWTVADNNDGTVTFTADAEADNVETTFAVTGDIAGSVQAGGKDGVAPGDTDTVDAAKSGAVSKAQTDVADFDKVVEAFLAVRDTKAELDGYNDQITEATKWFADNDYAAPVALVDGDSKNATNKSDVFLLSELEGSEAAAIGKFGDKGADYLFIGEGYTLVETAITDINKKVGSTSALEIFWKQSGDDLVLYVEKEAYAGDLLNNDEIVEITLVGKTIDSITLDGSFITAGV